MRLVRSYLASVSVGTAAMACTTVGLGGTAAAGYDRGGWVTLFYPRMGDIPIGSEVNAADQFANSWRQKF